MNDQQIIDTLSRPLGFHLTRTYRVWVGDHGYDTRPWADIPGRFDTVVPPIAYELEFASRHHQDMNDTVEAGDVLGWLYSLPDETIICIPEFSGHRNIGVYVWEIQNGKPVPLGYDCLRMQASISPTGEYKFWDECA